MNHHWPTEKWKETTMKLVSIAYHVWCLGSSVKTANPAGATQIRTVTKLQQQFRNGARSRTSGSRFQSQLIHKNPCRNKLLAAWTTREPSVVRMPTGRGRTLPQGFKRLRGGQRYRRLQYSATKVPSIKRFNHNPSKEESRVHTPRKRATVVGQLGIKALVLTINLGLSSTSSLQKNGKSDKKFLYRTII